jgi:predicted phosphate transport protein (TIGR00153 family)
VGFRLKPRDEKFFDFFNQLSESILEATEILKLFFENPQDPSQTLDMIKEVEERGDQILSTVMNQINSSFVTPFDREDILLLTRELNNVLDHIQGTMEKVIIYKAGKPKDVNVLKMVYVLQAAAEEIKTAVDKLPQIRSKHQEIIESCEAIRSYEQEGDYLYRAGIALLFENTENVVEIIKWKEIYEHLETTLDYCENVSNILKGVAVKYV